MLYSVLTLVAISILIFAALQFSFVQTRVVGWIAHRISEETGTEVRIERVNFRPFNHLILNNVYLADQKGDTLAYISTLDAGIRKFNLNKGRFAFGRLSLDSLVFHLKYNAQGVSNLQFIIDHFAGTSSGSQDSIPPFLTCSSLKISNSAFSYYKEGSHAISGQIDFDDLSLSHINLEMESVCLDGDSLLTEIRELTLIEKSGFKIHNLAGNFQYSPRGIDAVAMIARAGASEMDFPELHFYSKTDTAWNDFINEISISASIRNSSLAFSDLNYFSTEIEGMREIVYFSGNVKGKVNDFKVRDFDLKYGADTHFKGKITVKGLPDFYNSFILADVAEFSTTRQDVLNFSLPKSAGVSEIPVPEELSKFGLVRFKGNFTGYPTDFVTFGTLQTNLGQISTDLLIKQLSDTSRLEFSGKIATLGFELEPLMGKSAKPGKLSFDARVKGFRYPNDSVVAHINGRIDQVELFEYNYTNIDVNGDLTGKNFYGMVKIADPNLGLSVFGKASFSDTVPVFDLNANLNYARLFPLKLHSTDSLASVACGVECSFSGSNLDALNGKISFSNLHYTYTGGEFVTHRMSLTSYPVKGLSQLALKSDFLEAELTGKVHFASLPAIVQNFGASYFPSLFLLNEKLPLSPVDFRFSINFFNSSEVTKALVPELFIAENSTFNGSFKYPDGLAVIDGFFPKLNYGSYKANQFKIHSVMDSDGLKADFQSKWIDWSDYSRFSNLEISSNGKSDSLNVDIQWNNNENVENSGKIQALIAFTRKPLQNQPVYRIHSLPSQITIQDSLWEFQPSMLVVDSGRVEVRNFQASRNQQKILISGIMSSSPADALNFNIENLQLANFNTFTESEGYVFSGLAEGKARLSNLFSNAIFDSDLELIHFMVNDENFGNTFVNSRWIQEFKKVDFRAFSKVENVKRIDIKGEFFPTSRALDFYVRLDRFNLKIFEPYLEGLFSDIAGIASDSIHIYGNTRKPEISGSLKLQKAAFTVDYLKTRYFFTDKVRISSNGFHFDKIAITDSKGKTAILNGAIRHQNLKDFHLDLNIDATELHVLNTTESDNNLFFGNGFATGKVKISGPISNIVFDASVKTGKETRFFVPLLSESDIEESSFVSFMKPVSQVSNDAQTQPLEDETATNLQMNFNLEVTPEAMVQLIFNSKTGDIIQGNGNGNIRMVINTAGDFNMFGEYIINQGYYTFTLQNILSKRFEVKKGGNIRWNGNPEEAIIDIEAVYPVSASLDALLMDTSYIYRQKTPVQCRIFLTNRLLSPTIRFALDMPEADEKERALLSNLPEDEVNKQFLSLILINAFQPLNYLTQGVHAQTSGSNFDISRTASEFLSNQLSHWLSQINNDFDIGFNYRPGDQLTSDQIDVALQTQLFNDRLRINGKMGVGGQYANTNNIAGDVEVDLKLNESGKLRLKAFTKANNQLIYDEGPYTQGVALFYREEFDDFDDLLRKLRIRK